MKKSFLLIALFALMFLGLGNYTFGQTSDCVKACETTNTTCLSNAKNDEARGVCETNFNDCKAKCQGSNESQMGCTDNEHLNAITNICVCNDGYKKVDGVCTSCSAKGVCCGIELNTSVPFIGKCIESEKTNRGAGETNVTGETAFPVLMGSLTKILVTAILIVSFVLILIGGIMIATGNPGGKKMIIKVVIGIALLGASGVILRLINPNFFG